MADTIYQTKNGTQTTATMAQQLASAGYNGPTDAASVAEAYARTTGGPVTVGGGPSGTNPAPGQVAPAPGNPALPPGTQLANTTAANQLLNQAQQAAYQAYLNARLNLETDAQAFSQAQQAFTNKISEAGLTGSYNGAPTQAAQTAAADRAAQVAGLTGVYTPPGAVGGLSVTPEQKALVTDYLSKNPSLADPAYQKVLMASRGWVFFPGEPQGLASTLATGGAGLNALNTSTGGVAGTPTLAAINQQAQLSGTYNGVPTEAAREFNAKTATDYLSLISTLKGPQDYAQYLRVLGSTPGGLKDLVASAAGQYRPASGATTTAPTVGASLGGLVNDVTQGAGAGGGATAYGDYQATAAGLPKPNQISADAWNAYTDSQKKLLLGMYENQGYNVNDVQDLYKQSLPKYSYSGAGTVKLA